MIASILARIFSPMGKPHFCSHHPSPHQRPSLLTPPPPLLSFTTTIGSLFALGLSIFGVFFLSLLAILITHDYPYAGEWFESKSTDPSEPVAPLEEQRIETVHSLWMAVGLYLAIAAASGAAVCVHRVRGVL
jgi:hypothetical protein